MSLDRAIKSGKEHRKPYRGSKRADRSCRNHGGCSYCERNRTLDRYDKPTKRAILDYKKGEA